MRDVNEIETKQTETAALRMSDAQRIAQFCDDPGVGAHNLAMTPLPYLPVAAEGWIMTLNARVPLAERLCLRG